jgi:hypothetical protein
MRRQIEAHLRRLRLDFLETEDIWIIGSDERAQETPVQ